MKYRFKDSHLKMSTEITKHMFKKATVMKHLHDATAVFLQKTTSKLLVDQPGKRYSSGVYWPVLSTTHKSLRHWQ